MTYHSGSLVKGDHPVDGLLRAYERHVLPRVFARCAELVAVSPVSLAHATGRAHLVPPGVDSTLFTPPATPDEPRAAGPLRRPGRAHLALEGSAGPRRLAARGCASSCPTSGSTSSATATTSPPCRRRPSELGVADLIDWHGQVDHDELPPLLPAGGRDRAAVADRVRVVRDDAGRGDGQRLPGRRLRRRRDPVRDPRRRRRPARPAGRRRRAGRRPGRRADRPRARRRARAPPDARRRRARWDWSRQEERTIRVHRARPPGRAGGG